MNLITHRQPDPAGVLLGTHYEQFTSCTGLTGLMLEKGKELHLLVVIATRPRKGQFREFIRLAKEQYETICVWELWNENLAKALERYDFKPTTDFDDGEWLTGYRWDKACLSTP